MSFACAAGDCLEHYLRCPVVARGWLSRFARLSDKVSVEAILLLTVDNMQEFQTHVIARAVFLDCVHAIFQAQKQANIFFLMFMKT